MVRKSYGFKLEKKLSIFFRLTYANGGTNSVAADVVGLQIMIAMMMTTTMMMIILINSVAAIYICLTSIFTPTGSVRMGVKNNNSINNNNNNNNKSTQRAQTTARANPVIQIQRRIR